MHCVAVGVLVVRAVGSFLDSRPSGLGEAELGCFPLEQVGPEKLQATSSSSRRAQAILTRSVDTTAALRLLHSTFRQNSEWSNGDKRSMRWSDG